MAHALVGQDYSARNRAGQAGITHGAQADVLLTVGVTPGGGGNAGKGPVILTAHFCSSRLAVRRLIVPGDGLAIKSDCPVVLPDGLPAVNWACIIRCPMLLVSNGRLAFRQPRDVLAVPVPGDLLQDCPWSYEGGSEDVAEYLTGQRNLDEMFSRFGQLIGV